jgi:hypothetical protein
MTENEISKSDALLAANTAHDVFCTLRRLVARSTLLSKERLILAKLSDAAHNLPIMITAKDGHWTSKQLHEDVAECQRLMKMINSVT